MNFSRISKLSQFHFKNDIKRYLASNKNEDKSDKLVSQSKQTTNEVKTNNEQSKIIKKENIFNEFMSKDEFKYLIGNMKNIEPKKTLPVDCDVLIIGGGIIGASCAYFIKSLVKDMSVVVLERDSNYSESSTFWSVGGFRQQFSLVENIQMSLFGSDFIRKAKEYLKIENTSNPMPVDLDIHHDGYLFLASKSDQVDKMINNHKIQLYEGAKVKLLNSKQLKNFFPWLNTDDLEMGSFGYQNEGWLDSRRYLTAMRCKAESLGAKFLKGNLVGFEANPFEDNPYAAFRHISKALIDDLEGNIVKTRFNYCVNAAGPWAGQVASLAGLGDTTSDPRDRLEHNLSAALPIEPRKRYIYLVHAPDGPLLNVPLTIDPSGVFFRRHSLSNTYLCGLNQDEASEPKDMDLNKIDYSYFNERIRPILEKRVIPFRNGLKVLSAWSGYYDYNTFDQNLIIGPHNAHSKFLFANGSSGHGLQHAAAIGNAITELIIYNKYKKIDLTRFGFERVLFNTPVKEIDVV